MAPGRSPDHLASGLPGCADQVARYGTAHPFTLDCLVRHLLDTGWQGALALGLDPTSTDLVVAAGIGWLRLTPTGRNWQPATQGTESPPPRPAPPDLAAVRLSACRECSAWSNDRCTIAGCGCSGLGHAERLSSRCPRGLWPAPAIPG